MRHRVHDRARPAVDAPDPGRQAHRGRRLPHRHPAGRPGPDRRDRGAPARHRRPAGPADVPALRREGEGRAGRPGHRGVAGRGRRQGGLRLVHRRQVVPLGREGHPGAPGDQPRRPGRHDRGRGHPHLARRQDLPRGRRRPRHGQDLCLRRGGPGGRHQAAPDDGTRRPCGRGGRRHLHRRLHGQGLPGRGPGRPVTGRGVLRGPDAPGRGRRRRTGRGRAPDDGLRRPQAPAAGAGQRGQRRGRAARPPLRRPGHRPVPHRAHVPRRAARDGREADPRGHRGGARVGPVRAAAPPEEGLRRTVRGDGRPARHHPPPRPAAARVPARHHRTLGAGGPGRVPPGAARERPAPAPGRAPAARAEPDAGPARRPPRPGHPRPVRHAGPRDRRGGRGAQGGQGRPARGDHDPAGGHGPGAGDRPRGGRQGHRGGADGHGHGAEAGDRHHDRAAARRADRRADRGGGGVLLLRHQRPHADRLGLQPRRRRGLLLHGLPGEGHLRRLPLRDHRQGRRGLPGEGRRGGRPAHPARPQARRLRRARRRPGVGPLLPRGRPRLRLLLPLPHPGRPPRSGPRGDAVRGQRPPLIPAGTRTPGPPSVPDPHPIGGGPGARKRGAASLCGGCRPSALPGRFGRVSEPVRQMTCLSSVTITATESMSMKRASSGLTSVR
ncbi:hypothetical protein SGPA1_30608 [Streptomyces misionensis JCM 4497]